MTSMYCKCSFPWFKSLKRSRHVLLFFGVIMTSPCVAVDNGFFQSSILTHSYPRKITEIAWSHEKTKIAIRARDTYIWDVVNDVQAWRYRDTPPDNIRGLAFSPDDRFVIIPAKLTGNINKPETFATQSALTYISSADPANIYHISDHELSHVFPYTSNFSLADDGSVLALILGTDSGFITLCDPNSRSIIGHVGQLINRYNKTVNPLKIAIDSRRNLLSAAYANGEVQIWDYKQNRKILGFNPSQTGVEAITYNPISGELITGSDGVITGAMLESNGRLAEGKLHDDPDSFVRAWNPVTGVLARKYIGTQHGVSSIAVSPNGRYVAAIEGGPLPGVRLLLWDAQTGALLTTVEYGRKDGDYPAKFSPDGRYLAVGIEHVLYVYEIK